MNQEDHSPIAAIDIGSNSVHLAIGKTSRYGGIEIIDSEKQSLQLGKALDDSGRMSVEAVQRTSDTIAALAKISHTYTKKIRIVATHATREAKNSDELLAAIKLKSGMDVEIIDGIEEARLTFLGIRHGLPVGQGRCLAVDVGGGSTEIILAQSDKIEFVTSLKLGAVVLTKQFLSKDRPSDSDIAKAREFIRSQIAPLQSISKDAKFTHAVLSSGTAKTLANIDVYLHHGEELDDINGHLMPAAIIEKISTRLISLREAKKIKTRLNISQNRSEIITAGTLIIDEITRLFGVKNWQYSSYSLREGLIVDTILREKTGMVTTADLLKLRSVQSMADQFNIDRKYANHVALLASQVFEVLCPYLLGKHSPQELQTYQDMLQACCFLHETGKFLSPLNYHRHSAYLIANASITGFTQAERYLIAYAVMVHRKGGTKPEQLGWARLYYENINLINALSVSLRVASCLNRTRNNLIHKLKLSASNKTFEISIVGSTGDITAEKQKLESDLKQLGRKLNLEVILG